MYDYATAGNKLVSRSPVVISATMLHVAILPRIFCGAALRLIWSREHRRMPIDAVRKVVA